MKKLCRLKNIYIAFYIKNLRAQRWTTSFYNVTGSRMEELSRQFKAREIDEKQLKEAVWRRCIYW